jgi:hypothetical protein
MPFRFNGRATSAWESTFTGRKRIQFFKLEREVPDVTVQQHLKNGGVKGGKVYAAVPSAVYVLQRETLLECPACE